MENKLKWQNTALEPVESFEKGEYEELLKYVEENELTLRSLFVNGNIPEFELTSKYGQSKMGYFEGFVKENPKFHALFKLGELYGYLHALGDVKYESDWNAIAMNRFSEFKTAFPGYASLSEKIITVLRNAGSITVEELTKCLNAEKKLTEETLHHLFIEGFVYCYDTRVARYTLSDLGIRLAKQLK